MKLLRTRRRVMMSAAIAIGLVASSARADVVAISPATFGGGSTLITFTGLADGVDVHGLLLNGVQFFYSLGPGQVIINGGPGVTNNISDPNVVSVVNSTGVLTLLLPSLQNAFGMGFALLTTNSTPNATIISLFNGATAVGSLAYNGVPDPTFAGGFAGIQSTLEFNRVELRFNPIAPAFAVDNIRFANLANVTVTPEPATFALVFTGIAGIGIMRRRRRARST